jgi:hypothetical protein
MNNQEVMIMQTDVIKKIASKLQLQESQARGVIDALMLAPIEHGIKTDDAVALFMRCEQFRDDILEQGMLIADDYQQQ